MRENWDFVTMDNYSADMAELRNMGLAGVKLWRERAMQAERMLAEVILAAGGQVKISDYDLHDLHRKLVIETWRNDHDRTFTLCARQQKGQE